MRFANIVFVLFVFLIPVEGLVLPLEAKETKRVLILYSQEKWHPAHELTDQGIREVFGANAEFDVEVNAEHLDSARFPSSTYWPVMADFLRQKYAGKKIDVIITVYEEALLFMISGGRQIFHGVPIVASELTKEAARRLESSPWRRFVTGTAAGDNVTDLLKTVLRMKPHTKRFALIAGTSPGDIYSKRIFQEGLKPYEGKFDLIDLTTLPMAGILSRVGSLPADTVILYSSMFVDAAGNKYVPRDALSHIAQRANMPIFGLYDSYLGHGIVGGRMVSFELHGKETAALAIRVMRGESPEAIPFGGEKAYVHRYDWLELKRWNIPESTIPAEGDILYKQFSTWEEHRWSIVGVFLLIVVEGVLIFGLVINLRNRHKAEGSLIKSKQELQNLTTRIIDAQEKELSHLARELHDDLTQRLAGLAIDAGIIEQRLKSLQVPAVQELNDMKMKLIEVSEDVHNISRQLHPTILDDLGLVEAVKSECGVFSRRTGIALSFAPDNMPQALPKDVSLCLYRVIQEVLKNIEKHAKTTQAQISMQGFSNSIRLLIQDAGAGFDPHAMKNKAGLGLSSIKERVGFFNGKISVKSEPGRGTEIEVFVPLEGRV